MTTELQKIIDDAKAEAQRIIESPSGKNIREQFSALLDCPIKTYNPAETQFHGIEGGNVVLTVNGHAFLMTKDDGLRLFKELAVALGR